MTPLPRGTLPLVLNWFDPRRSSPRGETVSDDLPLLDPAGPAPPPAPADVSGLSSLSECGRTRWRCLEALTLGMSSLDDPARRWQQVERWTNEALPLGALDPIDRQRFAAALIAGLGALDHSQVARLAEWLVCSGLDDPASDWLNHWFEILAEISSPDGALRLMRASMVSDLRRAIQALALRKSGAGNSTR